MRVTSQAPASRGLHQGNSVPTTAQLILALRTVGEPIAEPLRVQAQLGSQTTGEEAAAGGQEAAEEGGAAGGTGWGYEAKPSGDTAWLRPLCEGSRRGRPRGGDGACGQRPAATRWPGREGLTRGDTEGTPRPGREKLGEPPQTAPHHLRQSHSLPTL